MVSAAGPIDAVLAVGTIALHATVADHLAGRVTKAVDTTKRNLPIERFAERVGLWDERVALNTAYAFDADRAIAVGVAATERVRRLGVGQGAGPAKAFPVAKLGFFVAADLTSTQADALDAVGREIGAVAAVDTFFRNRKTEVFLASGPVRAARLASAEEATPVVGAGEARRALEVELARAFDRRATVLDTQLSSVAIRVYEAASVDLRATAVAEVALESKAAIEVVATFGETRDQAGPIGPIAVAPDGAVSIGEANSKVECDTLAGRRVADRILWAIEIVEALVGRSRDALDLVVPIDRAAGHQGHRGKQE